MASFFRRAGAEILRVIRSAAAPSPTGTNAILYGLLSDGATRVFAKDSGGTAYNLTANVQQQLKSFGVDSADGTVAISNDLARANFMGYAYRDFAIGETFTLAWRSVVAAVDVTWAEVAVGTGAWTAGAAPTITPIDFTSVAVPIAAATTNTFTVITLTSAIPKGRGLWAIIAEATTTSAATVLSGVIDANLTGKVCSNNTAGWRPSAQLGVATAFAISGAAPPKFHLSPPA